VKKLSPRHIFLLVCLLLAGVTTLSYWPMTRNGFVSIDDGPYILQNEHVRAGLTGPSLVWGLKTGFFCSWMPATWISHMADCQLYGVNPAGHHFTNLLLHVANTLLVFMLLQTLTSRLWPSALVAALFAWHPTHVESVAWASERKDVLSTFFFLLTILAYVGYVRGPVQGSGFSVQGSRFKVQGSRFWYAASLLLFALALMAKPMVVTLPFILLLLDFWPLQRIVLGPERLSNVATAIRSLSQALLNNRAVVLEKLPFFFLSLMGSIITFLVQKSGGAVSSLKSLSLQVRVENSVLNYFRYIGKTFWPAHLSPLYPYVDNPSKIAVITGGVVLAMVTLAFVCSIRRSPALLLGWLWFLGTLVPVIGLIQVGSQSIADRYLYIPSIGLFMVLVWGAESVAQFLFPRAGQGTSEPGRPASLALGTAGFLILAACLALTSRQITYWQNGVSLFQHAIQIVPDNFLAFDGLGKAREDTGDKLQALELYQKAIDLAPTYLQAHYNKGTVLSDLGRYDEAIPELQAALKIDPQYADAHHNLGSTYLKMGRLDDAFHSFTTEAKIRPENSTVHYSLGTVRLMQSRFGEACDEFSRAVALKNDYGDAHRSFGVALINLGKTNEGFLHFEKAVGVQPDNPDSRFNFGLACLDQNKPAEAEAQFAAGLKLRPQESRFHYRLAIALARQHKSKEAIQQYEETIRLAPDFAQARSELAALVASDAARSQ